LKIFHISNSYYFSKAFSPVMMGTTINMITWWESYFF